MVARVAFLAVALLPAIAAAAPPTRAQAEACEKQHRGTLEVSSCGELYFAMYSADPSARDNDEILYNAGVNFAQGRAVSAALQAFALLRKYYPQSKIAPKALAYSARLYADTAMYDRAAELLEEYAKKYAGEKDAYNAMSDAVYYRKALGDDDKAIEDTKYFVKNYAMKMPREAANAHFALTAIYEKRGDRDAVHKHLKEHIRRFGGNGLPADRAVIVHAKLGEIAWSQSCPVKPLDGACVRVKPAKRQPVCARGATTTLEVVKRDTKQLKAAREHFAMAQKLFERVNGRTEGDEAAARYYYARAVLAGIDADSEAQLASVPPKPVAGFDAWLQDHVRATEKTARKYESVIAIKDSATSIIAAARIARTTDTLATAVLGIATKQEHCAKLEEAAAHLLHRATMAYGVCLMKASELSWFDDEGGSACERALVRMMPEHYPPLREHIGSATNAALLIAGESLTSDLESEIEAALQARP
jgi:tetratricopeptide (TPR) repeat protein